MAGKTCSAIRFVAQFDSKGKWSYGYHHSQCEGRLSGMYHSAKHRMTLKKAAALLKKLNGKRAVKMGFVRFYTWVQYYGKETCYSRRMGGRTQVKCTRPYIKSSKKNEIKP